MSDFLANDELLARYLDGVANEADLAVLQERLVAQPELADALATLTRFEMLLQAQLAKAETDRPTQPPIIQAVPSPESPIPSTAPVFNYLGSALHGAVGYCSSGWPVAYLVATVIFGIGLLIGSHGVCVRSSAGCQAILLSPLSLWGGPGVRAAGPRSPLSPQSSAESRAWWSASGSVARGQGPESD